MGSLFKEAVIVLPAILFSYPWIWQPRSEWKRILIFYRLRILPFLLALFFIGIAKAGGGSPLQYPDSHPYALSIKGFVQNWDKYILWMSQSTFPFLTSQQTAKIVFSSALIFLMGRFIVSGDKDQKPVRRIAFLLVWGSVGLLPVLFLPNHTFRYYATYSLAPFVAILWSSLRELIRISRLPNALANILILVPLFGFRFFLGHAK